MSNFNWQQQKQQTAQQLISETNHLSSTFQSVFKVCLFGDDRDSVLADLNYVQASWGAGKGYYQLNTPPVSYANSNTNFLYRLVGLAYSNLHTETNEDGKVILYIAKPYQQVIQEEGHLLNVLSTKVGTSNVKFTISLIKKVDETQTSLTIHADDRSTLRRFLASELVAALQNWRLKSVLEGLSIVGIVPKTRPDQQTLQKYLETPPPGISIQAWRKAQLENPDKKNMIPVVVRGPKELQFRIIAQQNEMKVQLQLIPLLNADIAAMRPLHHKYAETCKEIRRKHAIMSHRIMVVVLKMLMIEKHGQAIDSRETNLMLSFQELKTELTKNESCEERLNSIKLKVAKHVRETTEEEKRVWRHPSCNYAVDPALFEQLKEYLQLQQKAIKQLVGVVKQESSNLQNLFEGIDMLKIGSAQAKVNSLILS